MDYVPKSIGDPIRNEDAKELSKSETKYIGIDLGTTYSCVAVLENDQLVSIPCDNGQTTIPSIVGYCEDAILVGSIAASVGIQSENMLHDSKRLIGWEFLYDLPNANPELWSFKVDTKDNSAGYILNKRQENEKFVKPEEVSAEILKILKTTAETYLKKEVAAVITVPAQFSDKQRDATKRAADLAGLKLIHILEEPIASALAYNQKMELEENSKLLIVDFGGGTLDITIIETIDRFLKVKALTGDQHLGGQDIDDRIMKYVISEHLKKSPGHNFRDPRTLRLLRTACRKRKEALANTNSVNIMISPNNQDDTPINVRLTQEKLNELCNDIFAKITDIVDRAINMADLKKEDINYVVILFSKFKK
ncbi:hypothetical protein WR25_01883 isoform D [Diploscapter pachys]|uniref:Uncharacterized protein n=1 Tax=Diploscapter pachys TaxID=2018661 RepID=A0A2A2LA13_9BILA|nr:hypothetical protein WR25_01883 isoform B [Diploscapter pachys]PAV82986.1 hypothetical protein WR25_01883 isoform D [Diploscapter pachys]